MKYEVCRLRKFSVIALQQSVDGQTDGQTVRRQTQWLLKGSRIFDGGTSLYLFSTCKICNMKRRFERQNLMFTYGLVHAKVSLFYLMCVIGCQFYGRLRLIRSVWRASKFSVFKIDRNGNFVGLLHHPFWLQLILAPFGHYFSTF